MSLDTLSNLISNHIGMRLRSLPKHLVDDIYAISLYMNKGDIQEPMLTFSFNTRSQIARVMASEANAFGNPSDESEATWNYAFWMQTPNSSYLTPPHGEDGVLWGAACKDMGLEYLEDDDFDIDGYEDGIGNLLAKLAISVSLSLHASGIFVEKFGRILPIVIHELEYYDEIASITKSGNPEGVADEFINWVSTI